MKRIIEFMLAICLAPTVIIQAAELDLLSPLDYQVVQRQTKGGGTIRINGLLSESAPHNAFLEARISQDGSEAAWQRIDSLIAERNVSAFLRAPAGGWKRLDVRIVNSDGEFARASVEHVGIGEIFVIAGQSNSANYGEEKQTLHSDRVAAFDGSKWQIANDPQPRAKGRSGSFIPAFGDELVAKLDVPIGIVACGIGGTSVREWLPQGAQFANPPTIESRVEKSANGQWISKGEAYDALVAAMKELPLHGFRAVLWHQGESDANQKDPTRTLPGALYREYLEKIIRDSQKDIGWDAPWIVAQTTYHVPGDESSPDIRAQASLWKDGIAGEGPDTDTLKGDMRERNGQGVHFSAKGLRAHGQMWAKNVLAWLDRSEPEGITVDSDFEGGSAEVVRVEQASQTVRIMPALVEGRGWPCWWSLKVAGLKPGSELSLEVQPQSTPYRDKTVLASNWSQPKHAWQSDDGGETWSATPAGKMGADKVMHYTMAVKGSELHVAWGPPFGASDAEKLLQTIAEKLPKSQRFELTQTRGGRSVNGIRIGAEDARHQVWVNARHHAWEAGGSQVGRGFIQWIASDDAAAVALRQDACIHFIPIIDVDNVALGAGGKDAQPRDHNRDWADKPIYPEIAAAQKMIREIHEQYGLDVYIDLHNPGANDPIFFYGPFGYQQMQGSLRKNYQRWIALAAKNIREPVPLIPEYRFANYVTTEEERGRMSSGWVRNCIGDAGISVTLETGWNNPLMSIEGYGSIGAGLGRALAEYLSEPSNP